MKKTGFLLELGNFYLVKVLCVSSMFMGGANRNSFSIYKKVKIEIKNIGYLAV